MFAEIFSIIAPVFLCAGLGFIWAKKHIPYETAFVTRLVTLIGFPCLIFVALIKAELDFATLGTMGVASAVTVIAFAVIAYPALRAFKIQHRESLPSMLFANTGNIGLPLCLFAFGEAGLAMAIAYFTVNILLVFIVSPAIATGRANVGEVLKMPLVWAVPLALIIKFLGLEVPVWLFRTLDLVGGFTIPLMLITLGVSLATLHIKSLPRSVWLSVLRLSMGFAVGWGTAVVFGYEGMARGVLIIECTMPVAVFNYLYAEMYDNKPEEVAGTVLVSTAMSFATLPALLWFVI